MTMALRVIDSHTGGEPTRTIIDCLPEVKGSVSDRLNWLRNEADWIRTSLCREPRGSEVAIGAALFPPSVDGCVFDVVFFNNESYLGMCGHGTIGVMATLAWSGDVKPGQYRLNTVAGTVSCELHDKNTVSFENVPAYRKDKDLVVNVPGHGDVVGDVAYGGNWFFLVTKGAPKVNVQNIGCLTEFCSAVMDALEQCGITGANNAAIDHVEVFGPPTVEGCHSKNYVLCPGKQYDRSPCGTGTSAKLACLYEDGILPEGSVWKQESIIGSVFEGSVRVRDGLVYPVVKGQAFVTGLVELEFDQDDPFRFGF